MKERGKKNILILYKSGIGRFLQLVILLNSCVHYTYTVSKIFLISAHKNRACYGCNSILYVQLYIVQCIVHMLSFWARYL